MALSEQQFASLLQSLDELRGAASYLGGTALDAAAYQHACTRLSPAAQHMLEAFKGFTPPPPVVAAASRASCDIERFPEDVLGALLAFVDLPMRFTCVVASRTLRDACMRVSPQLEHELVLKRFPLLTGLPVTGTSLAGVPAPGELFRMYQEKFDGERFESQQPWPSISLVEYTLAGVPAYYTLALELRLREAEGPWESAYVGSRVISPQGADGALGVGASFSIPEGLYERALDHPHVRFSANVMVSRRSQTGRVRFARIYSGVIDHISGHGIDFEIDNMPYAPRSENPALHFIRYRADHSHNWMDPTLRVRWEPDHGPDGTGQLAMHRGPSELLVSFKWITADFDENMSERDVANCLEHYVDWSE